MASVLAPTTLTESCANVFGCAESCLELVYQDRRLIDDILIASVKLFCTGEYYTVDSINVTDRFTDKASEKHQASFGRSPITALLVHNQQLEHWSLIIYRPRLPLIQYYDSLRTAEVEDAALANTLATLRWLGNDKSDIAWKRMVSRFGLAGFLEVHADYI